MEELGSVETEEYTLRVFECLCGFHVGLDATFLEFKDIETWCPSCNETIFIKGE
jgi:hypothetical protein